jgi:hypothetical protein
MGAQQGMKAVVLWKKKMPFSLPLCCGLELGGDSFSSR